MVIPAIIHISYNQEHRFDQQNLSIFRNGEEKNGIKLHSFFIFEIWSLPIFLDVIFENEWEDEFVFQGSDNVW